MDEKKALEAAPAVGGKPTKKAMLFVRLLLEGKPTVDAHRLAGYKGDPHAAYELRARLKGVISTEAERRGITLEGLKAAAAALNELPVVQASVNVREKLAIMAETRKIVELSGGPKHVTLNALVIERPEKGPVVEEVPVVETSLVEEPIVKEPETQPVDGSGEPTQVGEDRETAGKQGV